MQAEIIQSEQFVANKDVWFPALFCSESRCSKENQLTKTLLLFKGTLSRE